MSITFEFAVRDDCLDKMVPSDLRQVVAERDHALAEVERWKGALKEIAMMCCRKPDMVDHGARCAHCIADAALKK